MSEAHEVESWEMADLPEPQKTVAGVLYVNGAACAMGGALYGVLLCVAMLAGFLVLEYRSGWNHSWESYVYPLAGGVFGYFCLFNAVMRRAYNGAMIHAKQFDLNDLKKSAKPDWLPKP